VIAAVEFAAIGFAAAVTGVALSFAGAAVLSELVFDSPWVFSPVVPALIVSVTTLLCCTMGLLASRETLVARPATLLNAD
jgi:predicted lysophospholipase L1 biosynthesis ABC-type transport system permease subunit